jgi:hypothetical protein
MSRERRDCLVTSRDVDRSAYFACAFLLMFSIVFQKFAIPGTNGAISLTLIALVGATAVLALTDTLRLNSTSLIFAILFFASAATSLCLSRSPQASRPSFWFALAAQCPLVFSLASGRLTNFDMLRLASAIGAVLSVVAVVQLAIQSTLGPEIAFWFDYNLPRSMALHGYNNLNTLAWDNPYLKSNGVFFSEPSYFCQFLALCFLAEVAVSARPLRLLLMAGGLVTTYSGTGLTTLAVFLPFAVPSDKRREVLLVVAAVAVAILAGSSVIEFDAVTTRVDEFSTVGTSGYARFISIWELLPGALSTDLITFLFGRGPGTVTELYLTRPYDMFAATYAKVLYEYGALGFALYLAFFYSAIIEKRSALCWPLAFTYFLLGGYLQDAAIITLVLVLGGWFEQDRLHRQETQSDHPACGVALSSRDHG